VSTLRAKCPSCRTLTAVAVGLEYECHACGRTFAAGLVRVPRAWGDGGEPMIESAWLRCLEIGERPDLEGSVAGRGSSLAARNLVVLYEGTGQAASLVIDRMAVRLADFTRQP
jgi:hypothetical protein